jgi:hypothetical protein
MVERFATLERSGDEDRQIFLDLRLPDQIVHFLRAECIVHAIISPRFGVEGAGAFIGHKMIIPCDN